MNRNRKEKLTNNREGEYYNFVRFLVLNTAIFFYYLNQELYLLFLVIYKLYKDNTNLWVGS